MFAHNISIVFQWLVFLGISFVAIVAALLMITQRNPIHSALLLIATLVCTAVMFFLLNRPFIAIIQLMVYAGAIVMLIIFVIMLLDLEIELRKPLKLMFSKGVGVFGAFLIMMSLLFGIRSGPLGNPGGYTPERLGELGTVKVVGKLLLTEYLLPFEAVSILLVAAIVGAIVLAKRSPSEKE